MKDYTEILQSLADKFGTTVDFLWQVMLKQAVIHAITEGVFIILISGLLFFSFKVVNHKTSFIKDGEQDADWHDEMSVFLAWLFVAILSVITVFSVGIGFREILTCIINPEYWALNNILN